MVSEPFVEHRSMIAIMIRISSSHISGIGLVLSKKHGFTDEQQWHKILEVLNVKRLSSPPEKHKFGLDLLNTIIVIQNPKSFA